MSVRPAPFVALACGVVSHSHREHDGSEVQIKSIDFTFYPRRDGFSVNFEFTLIN